MSVSFLNSVPPQFSHLHPTGINSFSDKEFIPLKLEHLEEGFTLRDKDVRIDFSTVDAEPRGALDGMDASDGQVHVVGWGFDDDTPDQATRVHVYVGGRAGDSNSKCYDIGLAEVQREESVGKHGFDYTFSTDKAGMQEIYIYILDTSGTGYKELGPYQLLIPIPNGYLLDSTVYNDAFYAEQNESVRNMTTEERKQHWITTGSYQGLQASPAFFAIEYRNLHSDLDREYGASNYQLYIKHFIEFGIGEFRSSRNMFNPAYYMENYKDLKDNFKDDYKCYYIHFADAGYKEGRVADHRLKVYFDTSNGGTSSQKEREMTIGQALGTLPTLTRQGYTGAWYTAKTGGSKVTSSYVPAGTKDLTIYAQWTAKKVTGISIPGTQTVSIGESKTLSATVTPTDALNRNLTWKSSNTSVATVTNGTIKGIREGTATVTATAADGSGVSASCTVTVKPTVTGLTLNRSSIQLADSGIGSSYVLKAEKTPSGGQGTVSWRTSNSGVVQVTQSGVLTAKGTGTATVTASIVNGPSVTCTVSVSAMPLMTLPAGLKSIEEEAFLNTPASRILIPSGVESIGARAFAESQALRYVMVPDSVTAIADDAFADDPNLCLICGGNSKAKEYAVSHGIDYIEDTVIW